MNETLQSLSNSPAKLEAIFNQFKLRNKFDMPRAAGKWTPRQILAHLSDVEAVQRVRVMAMLSQDNSVMLGFDADAWAAAGAYTERDPRVSLTVFSALRVSNLELWRALTPQQLERRGTHPTRGEFSVGQWLGFVAKHDLNHLTQLEASLP